AFRKKRAQDRSQANAPAAPHALPDKEDGRDQQRSRERGQRKMRADREQQIAGLPEDECNAGPEIQRRLLSQQEPMSYRRVKIGLGALGKSGFVRVLHSPSSSPGLSRRRGAVP